MCFILPNSLDRATLTSRGSDQQLRETQSQVNGRNVNTGKDFNWHREDSGRWTSDWLWLEASAGGQIAGVHSLKAVRTRTQQAVFVLTTGREFGRIRMFRRVHGMPFSRFPISVSSLIL